MSTHETNLCKELTTFHIRVKKNNISVEYLSQLMNSSLVWQDEYSPVFVYALIKKYQCLNSLFTLI